MMNDECRGSKFGRRDFLRAGLPFLAGLGVSKASASPAPGAAITPTSGDATAMLQAAISASSEVLIPNNPYGPYNISGWLVVDHPARIHGEHPGVTISQSVPNTGVFLVTTPSPVKIDTFTLEDCTEQAAWAAIAIASQRAGDTTQDYLNVNSTFEQLDIEGFRVGFDFESAMFWHVNKCVIRGHGLAGVYVWNAVNPDWGDGEISETSISMGTRITQKPWAAIHQSSSGGLRVNNCKLLNHTYGYKLEVSQGSYTGVLLINDSSIENMDVAAVSLSSDGPPFGAVSLADNEVTCPKYVEVLGNSQWLSLLSIQGGPVNINGPGPAIDLQCGVAGATIGGIPFLGNGLAKHAISYPAAYANQMSIGNNVYMGFTGSPILQH